MSRYRGPGTILGGLPIIAEVSWGYDSFNMEHWAEIEAIYWQKRDGSVGKEIPVSVRDRAARYDSYFCNLIEQLNEQAASQDRDEADPIVLELI